MFNAFKSNKALKFISLTPYKKDGYYSWPKEFLSHTSQSQTSSSKFDSSLEKQTRDQQWHHRFISQSQRLFKQGRYRTWRSNWRSARLSPPLRSLLNWTSDCHDATAETLSDFADQAKWDTTLLLQRHSQCWIWRHKEPWSRAPSNRPLRSPHTTSLILNTHTQTHAYTYREKDANSLSWVYSDEWLSCNVAVIPPSSITPLVHRREWEGKILTQDDLLGGHVPVDPKLSSA